MDIDRDRALALGVTPEQIQNALYSCVRRPAGFEHLRAGESILRDHGSRSRSISASPDALSKLYVRSSKGSLVPLDEVVDVTRTRRAAERQPFRPASRRRRSHSICSPGFRWARRRRQVNDAVRELRMPATITVKFPGNGEGVPGIVPGSVDPADRRDSGDLHRAGHSVRELHPSDHDSFRVCRRQYSARC